MSCKPFFPPVEIRCGENSDYGDAQIIVITAGARQQSGESRLAMLQRNVAIIEGIMDDIAEQSSQALSWLNYQGKNGRRIKTGQLCLLLTLLRVALTVSSCLLIISCEINL